MRAPLWLAWMVPLVLLSLLFLFQGYLIPSSRARVSDAIAVLCLTSTPPRLAESWIQDNILQLQNLEVLDRVVLSLPWTFKKTGEAYVVPLAFAAAPKLRILRCEDEGPATKLLSPLRNSSILDDHIIVVGDDDMKYRSEALAQLVGAIREHPTAVHTMCQKKLQGFLSFGGYKRTLLPLLSIPRPAACERVDDDFFMAALDRLGVPLRRVAVEGCLSFCEACALDFPSAATRFLTDKNSLTWEDVLTSNKRKRSVQRCLEEMGA
jgi:hypothetical protein